MITQHTSVLAFETFVAPPVPVVTSDLAPGQSLRAWSPLTATLISGERDAVLVDPLMTIEQGRAVADWVAASGKNLTTVYITHGHGDHWFGLGVIRERYPRVRAVATVGVVDHMRSQVSPKVFSAFWESRFPGQIQRDVAVAEPLSDSRFELEGHELVAVEVGHTDTDDTTVLHVPSIGLVVAGDVAYNDVHVYLGESDHDRRLEWIHALDIVEALQSRAVVAGHKRAGRPDAPNIVEETRAYIRDFDRLAEDTSTAEELYERMLSAYPNRVNPGALWSSARAVKG
ncbi:MAG TPA: MBL fold metallo-hydrolase [Vicinamibacterales bacterium]|nr:MBL fold metallo-hydrolase [Vicinamibacterales bacterium]